MKIITPHGTFALASSSVARLDVTPQATEISVRKGRVIAERPGGAAANGTWKIEQGQRIRLDVNTAKPVRAAPFNRDAMDIFDRWALGLLVVGNVGRLDGLVLVERRVGGSLQRIVGVQGVHLEEGDRLVTAARGRVQFRLSSFTYLYVDEMSDIRVISVNQVAIRFELLRGAMFVRRFTYPATFHAKAPEIEVELAMGSVTISKSGEYRVNTSGVGTSIKVRAGSLDFDPKGTLGAKSRIRLKEGQKAILSASEIGQLQILKHDNTSPDQFDQWVEIL